MAPHPSTKFKIQMYYQNEPKFNGFYSRNNSPKIKDETYVINLDGYESIGTHWIALYANAIVKVYFNSFWVEHFPKEIKKFMGNKNTIINIYRIKAYSSIMCGYLYIGFIDFKLKGQSLLYYTNLFSPGEYDKKR